MVRSFPRHLYLLDILRGLASLSVVVWHYQQFFMLAPGELPIEFDRSKQPLYVALWPLYTYGYRGVQLFFVLSGFVFYLVYCEQVNTRSVSCFEFFLLRFSRLYPLYFLTLIYVAVLQLIAQTTLASFIVYPFNDLRHFLLNLFFASDWGLQYGYSFNAPTWSVSVEIILYAVFFIVALTAGKNVVVPVILMAVGYWIGTNGMSDIGWGLYCFFAGGIGFPIFDYINRRPITLPWTLLIPLTALILSSIGIWGCFYSRLSSQSEHYFYVGGVPSVILLIASIQNYKRDAGKSIRVIGDITYATYLLHFPVQLSIVWVTRYFAVSPKYNNLLWLILFRGIVIVISVPTYYHFELPAQSFFRRHLRLAASAT